MINQFLCYCAGANTDILKKFPHERSKQAAIGGTVLFTGILATISGGYAMYKVFNNTADAEIYAIFFGILWGLMIFNLDRLIVMSIKKTGNIKQELKVAWPRIVFAILISIVIAKPMEVKLFEDRISSLIKDDRLNRDSTDLAKLDEIYGSSRKAKQIDGANSAISDLRNRLNTEEPNTQEYTDLKSELTNEKASLESAQNNRSSYQAQINNLYGKYGVKTYKDMPVSQHSEARRLNRGRDKANRNISQHRKNISTVQQQIKDLRSEFKAQIQLQIDAEEERKGSLKKEKEKTDEVQNKEVAHAHKVNAIAFSPNLITQLEALHKLTAFKKGNMGNFAIGLFITLLIIALELSPIFVKIFSPEGLYDVCLAAELAKQTSVINDKANKEFLTIQIETQNGQNIKTLELQAKERLISTAIGHWETQELANLNSGLTVPQLQTFISNVQNYQIQV